MQFYCQNTIRPKKDTKWCLRVEKWSRSVEHLFLFLCKACWILFFVSFSCRIRQCFCSSMIRFVPYNMCTFSSSTNNFAHAQTLFRMSSRSGRMNIARVNIECFTGFKKIKQRRISFVLGYLHMIWKISTAISIKHRILATFNK